MSYFTVFNLSATVNGFSLHQFVYLVQGSQTRGPGANWGPRDDILWPPTWQILVLVRPARCQTHILLSRLPRFFITCARVTRFHVFFRDSPNFELRVPSPVKHQRTLKMSRFPPTTMKCPLLSVIT